MRPSASQKSWLGQVAERYHAAMDEETLSYLASRGIDRDAVDGNLLGLVAEPDPAHTHYEGRLCIPFITPTGIVYLRFRCLKEHDCKELGHGKYEGLAGEGTHLYNVRALQMPGTAIGICEGEIDALVATMSGLPSVGVPGAHNWKPFYNRLFEDYERVILLGDGDEAGREFVATLSRNINEAVRRPLPKGEDVNSYVMEYGAEKFLEYVGLR